MISTDVGGVAEVVTDGENGLLVPAGDPAALAAAIRRFFSEAGSRSGSRRPRFPRSPVIRRDAILGRIEAVLVEAAR